MKSFLLFLNKTKLSMEETRRSQIQPTIPFYFVVDTAGVTKRIAILRDESEFRQNGLGCRREWLLIFLLLNKGFHKPRHFGSVLRGGCTGNTDVDHTTRVVNCSHLSGRKTASKSDQGMKTGMLLPHRQPYASH